MRLSPNFALSEFTASTTAQARRIDNTLPGQLLPAAIETAAMLERIRAHLGGAAITISSGYRSDALNRAVGGVQGSDHTRAQAADILAPAYGPPLRVAQALAAAVDALGIGQIILERVGGKQWVHVSTAVPAKPINRVITITDAGAVPGIVA